MDMDRNPSRRGPKGVAARLLAMGYAPLDCSLLDIGEQGARVVSISQYPELIRGALALKRGDVVDLLVELGDKAGSERVRAEVVRIAPSELHLHFTQPQSPAMKRVLACVAAAHRKPSTELIAELHRQCASIGGQLMELFIDAAEVDLFQAARDASSNVEQQAFFDSLYQINANKEQMTQSYLAALRAGFDSSVPLARTQGGGVDGELAVVDKDAFEDWLSVNTLLRHLSEQTATLDGLAARYSLLAGKEFTGQTMPLGVPAFCYALQKVLASLNVPLPHRIRLYQAFERIAARPLPPFYQAINDFLVQSGVLPLWVPTTVKQDAAASTVPAVASSPVSLTVVASTAGHAAATAAAAPLPVAAVQAVPAANGALSVMSLVQPVAAASGGDVTPRLYDTLRVVRSLCDPATRVAADGGIDNAALVQLLDTFSAQQVASLASDDARLLGGLQQVLAQQAPQTQLNDEAVHRVALVEAIFEGILADRAIAESAKPQLRKLQLPLLRVVLQDEQFMTAPDHPARRLLNQLAVLSGFSDLGGAGLAQLVERITRQLSAQGQVTPDALNQAANDIDRLLKVQRDVHERNLQRVVSTYEGQEKLERANHAVRDALIKAIGAGDVPQVIIDLLNAGWRELMLFDYVKYGGDSHQWSEHLHTVLQLNQWLVQLDGATDAAPPRDEVETVINWIERELDHNAPGHYRHVQVTRRLRELLAGAQAGRAVVEKTPLRADDPALVGSAAAVSRPRKVVPGDVLSRWVARARTLEVGDWLGPMQRNDSSEDLRLAWVSHDKYRFVFVNRLGQKAADLTLDDVAQKLQQGWQKLDAQAEWSAVDKSMYQMLQRLYDELDYRRSHDDLTGLINRKEFEIIVDHSLVRIKREESRAALLYIDLDRFRLVNEYCGLDAGDRLLQEISRIISTAIPESANAARLGANEFGVLLDHCDQVQAEQLAELLRQRIQEYRFDWQQKQYSLTASIGLAAIDMYTRRFADVLRDVTAAGTAAKQHGGNRVTVATTEENTRSARDDVLNWVSRINRALDGNTLKLRCQKIAPLCADAGIMHYEILLGVEDEEEKVLIPPERFIYAAEQFNRMQDVDRWVFRNVIAWMKDNAGKVAMLEGVSVNLSGNSLNDDYFLDFIAEQFRTSGVSPHKVCFEVTETATIANLTKAADFIRQVKQLGCQFALDDFGTGLSSYEYLKRLPVDYLKIDGCFVRDVVNSSIDYAVVKSINEIGHFMGKKTIAEYVESEEIASKLREIGVDFVQGYGIERPKLLADV